MTQDRLKYEEPEMEIIDFGVVHCLVGVSNGVTEEDDFEDMEIGW